MRIGTRGSELATTQTGTIAAQIRQALGQDIETVIIQTQGDRVVDRPLRELEGRGYFTKEIEEALLSGEIDVPTLEGKAHVKVPAGTQSGQMFKLRGKGITNVNGRNHGDLFARLIVEVPSRLNSEQRRKLEEFAALCGDENTPMRKRFFDRAKEFFK